jgi:hypothetical protein
MLMELLTGDDQGIAHLATDDQQDDLIPFDIIEDAEVAHPQLVLRHRVGPEPLDGPGGGHRLVAEPGEDRSLQSPTLTSGESVQLRLGLAGGHDSEGHRGTLGCRIRDHPPASHRPHAAARGLFVFDA